MQKKIVAAFDFDGTLTKKDAMLPFIIFQYGYWKALKRFIPILPGLIGFVLGLNARLNAKEAILTAFFAGIKAEELTRKGTEFAKKEIPRFVRPEMIQKLKEHQKAGHQCFLVSAGIDMYLKPWSKNEGIQDLLCSTLAVDNEGVITGKLVGANCWGPEKKRRLEELLGPRDGYILYAYGDSRGDTEMLDMADYPVWV